MKRSREWLHAHRRQIGRGAIILACFLLVSGVVLALTMTLPVGDPLLYWEGGFRMSDEVFDDMLGRWWFPLVAMLLQACLTVLLCAVPGASMAVIITLVAIVGSNWKSFLISYVSVLISSTIMFFIGKLGGKKAIDWIAGEGSTDKAMAVIREKGTVYFPATIILPGFPDDALCMVAGAIRMNPWFYAISILVCKAIGVATIVWGVGVVPFDSFTSLWDWLVFLTVCLVWVWIGLKICRWIDAWLTKKMRKKK